MIIKTVTVRNFRCLENATLECDPLTALVGPNGCGKSSFLRALELFYAPAPRVTVEDWYNRDRTRSIEITVTFTGLSDDAKTLFDPYIQDGDLTVTRLIRLVSDKVTSAYYGSRLRNPDFARIRAASTAADAKANYTALREKTEYADLPVWTNRDSALAALSQWEENHRSSCRPEADDGQFFGFTGVGQGYLGRYTRFIFIPAVRDAVGDSTDTKGSPITELMDLVVRNAIAQREDIQQFKQDFKQRYEELLDPTKVTQLKELESRLTQTLQTYVPDARVGLSWSTTGDIDIPIPIAEVKLIEDGFPAAVNRTGHGLQRAFIVSLLQSLTVIRATTTTEPSSERGRDRPHAVESTLPDLVLAIEEPELYQHPSRQRHLASILWRLAQSAIPGVSLGTQVIYATHSPLFVGLDRFDQVRVLRKVPSASGPARVTHITQVSGERVAEILWEACEGQDIDGKPMAKYTWATLRPRLQSIMTPLMNEGFFADVAVLIEGEDDRAALLGVASALGHNLDAEGISVLPCIGKCNLDRPLVIFREFGIPTYVVWDGDRDKKSKPKDAHPEINRRLLRLVGATPADWPATIVDEAYACFECRLEETLRAELGAEFYDEQMDRCRSQLGIGTRKDAMKCPLLFQSLLQAAANEGRASSTLEKIVARVRNLRRQPVIVRGEE